MVMVKKILTSRGEFLLERVFHEKEIQQIKELDDALLAPHQGISYEVLRAIALQGGLIACKKREKLAGAGMLVLESIPPRIFLEKTTALLYGTMLMPDYRRLKLGSAMGREQEKTALEHNKTRLLLSVRPENMASIIMRLQSGFDIVDYRMDYFGNDPVRDARFIMEKKLNKNPLKRKLPKPENTQTTEIMAGEKPDFKAREKIARLFSNGFLVKAYLKVPGQKKARIIFSRQAD